MVEEEKESAEKGLRDIRLATPRKPSAEEKTLRQENELLILWTTISSSVVPNPPTTYRNTITNPSS